MNDLISRQAAIDAVETKIKKWNAVDGEGYHVGLGLRYTDVIDTLTELPSAQPTLHGYNVEHLELIAIVLQKEDLPPERVVEAITDIGRIVAIVRDEFEETLRRALHNMERETDDLQ